MTRGAPVSHFEAIDILLAEDSDSDAELTLRTLRMGRIMNDVKRVRDGVEALNLVFREGAYADRPAGLPKLILLDLQMPQLGGLEVIRRLRSQPATRIYRSSFSPIPLSRAISSIAITLGSMAIC
jgi:CheY-like chemotaxis protein